MENEKAIEIFNKWMDCKDAYQADPSCDGNCFSCEYYASAEEEKEAMLLAISALEKQEQCRWHSVAKEGNPPAGGYYMWSAVGGEVEKDFYWEGEWEHAKKYGYDVLAWKPVPKRYEVDK
jgi:hypothetical protein